MKVKIIGAWGEPALGHGDAHVLTKDGRDFAFIKELRLEHEATLLWVHGGLNRLFDGAVLRCDTLTPCKFSLLGADPQLLSGGIPALHNVFLLLLPVSPNAPPTTIQNLLEIRAHLIHLNSVR
jgi:hypothetical protein